MYNEDIMLAAFLTVAFVAWLWWKNPPLRRPIGWAVVFVSPLLLLPSLLTGEWQPLPAWSHVLSFIGLTALLVAQYYLFWRTHLTDHVHPHRRNFIWLVAGLVGGAVAFAITQNLTLSLIIAVGVDVLLVLVLWPVVWVDACFSALGLAFLYVFQYILLAANDPTQLFLAGLGIPLSGLTLFSLPVEVLLLVGLFGALWGPLFLAASDLHAIRRYGLPQPPQYHGEIAPRRRRKMIAVYLSFFLLAVVGGYAVRVAAAVPAVTSANPANGDQEVSIQQPLSLTFDQPVRRKDLQIDISPAVTGSWSFEESGWGTHFYKGVKFIPDRSLLPDTSYTLSVRNIANVFGRRMYDKIIQFHTKKLPTVAAFSVQSSQMNVPICDAIRATLDQPNTGIADFRFRLEPATDIDVTYDAATKDYNIKPKTCLNQQVEYHLGVSRQMVLQDKDGAVTYRGGEEPLARVAFTTKGAPNLSDYSPKGNQVHIDTKEVDLVFSEAMATNDVSAYATITPPLKGSWQWIDTTHLRYALSESMAYGTHYTLVLKPGLKDAQSGYLSQETKLDFSTIGRVQVVGMSPGNGTAGIGVSNGIHLTFNQEVDVDSAQTAFSFKPPVQGRFRWSGHTSFVFQPTNPLEKDTTYTYQLAPGVKGVYGQASTSTYSATFTTEESMTQLSIPLDYQDSALSCELASLKMALKGKGVSVSEGELLTAVGIDPTPRENGIWGDPDLAFVGNINGKQNSSGYGVHWDPIARAANQYRPAQVISGWDGVAAAEMIAKGNPIVFWGTYGKAIPDSWRTPGGRTITTWVGEHARTLIGFTGKASNPRLFIINDPIVGRLVWTRAQLESNSAAFGAKGVAIF